MKKVIQGKNENKKAIRKIELKKVAWQFEAEVSKNQIHILPSFTLKVAKSIEIGLFIHLKIKFLAWQLKMSFGKASTSH